MLQSLGPQEIPKMETERLILRKITIDDVNDIYEYASITDVTTFVLWDTHKTKQDSIDFIKLTEEQFNNNISFIWGIVIKSENKLIGTIDLRNWDAIHKCGEIGYVISQKYWNRGYVSEAMKTVIKFGLEELHLNRIEAHCEEENIGSWRVMEKCGMKYEGTLREKVFIKERFRSMKMYSILKSEWKKL
ncbi:MAG: N-acetyltransferase [Ignavibacteriales bacterium]|nr:MAG: N-acetyltransferase [Ignavibacteriales bacterium]